MSKTAFVFPGQGAQKPGMGKDFYDSFDIAEQIFEDASNWISLDMKAMAHVVREKGLTPDVTAGLSLGEYCAIEMAGGMSLKSAVCTVRERGILMEHAVPAGKGSMAAVLGMKAEDIENTISSVDGVEIANYNCPGQIVITGKKEGVERAAELLKENGAKRVIPLNVSGPFHSSMLKKAGQELEKILENQEVSPLKIPYVTNVTGELIQDKAEIKPLLSRQISSPVRWQQSVENMILNGVDTFVEIGPGRTLNGFIRKINRDVSVYSIQTVEDMEKVIQAVKEQSI